MCVIHPGVFEFSISALKSFFGLIIPSQNEVKSLKEKKLITRILWVCPETHRHSHVFL